MKPAEFFKLVFEMRRLQIAYFRHRKTSDLVEAKRLEKLVDEALVNGLDLSAEQRPNATQTTLFEEEG